MNQEAEKEALTDLADLNLKALFVEFEKLNDRVLPLLP